MKTLTKVMAALEEAGSPIRAKTYVSHGAPPDSMFGVSVADMKAIAKKIKGQQELAYELYETGNSDAQYLAGMVADGSLMTRKLLDTWAQQAAWSMVSEYTVPWVATESEHGHALAFKWIKDKQESVASSGWGTYAGYVTVTPDEALDLEQIEGALVLIEDGIGAAMNRVKYTMNGFVIAVGTYVRPLSYRAKQAGRKIGKVDVKMGDTSCKVPLAFKAILKAQKAGHSGMKRKTIKR